MKSRAIALIALTASASAAHALDRSGQPANILFETGNVVEFSLGYANPSIDGTDFATGAKIGNVADSFWVWGGGIKYDINEQWSVALTVDQPYGTEVNYPGDPQFTSLGGTTAIADSYAITAWARYRFNDNWSVHGGLKYQEISADIGLGGGAYGPLNGYNASFAAGGEFGYVVGAAYEIPDIALRVSLTYHSEITHDLKTVETGVPLLGTVKSKTEIVAPEAINLDFQTGIAEDTLLFGSVRYAKYSDTIISPVGFDTVVGPGSDNDSLTDIDNLTDIRIGIGRRFNEQWSGSIALGHQSKGEDKLVSPLAPVNGAKYVVLGAKYDVNERFAISGGVRYTRFGEAFPETGTPDTARAEFKDNSALSLGVKLTYRF